MKYFTIKNVKKHFNFYSLLKGIFIILIFALFKYLIPENLFSGFIAIYLTILGLDIFSLIAVIFEDYWDYAGISGSTGDKNNSYFYKKGPSDNTPLIDKSTLLKGNSSLPQGSTNLPQGDSTQGNSSQVRQSNEAPIESSQSGSSNRSSYFKLILNPEPEEARSTPRTLTTTQTPTTSSLTSEVRPTVEHTGSRPLDQNSTNNFKPIAPIGASATERGLIFPDGFNPNPPLALTDRHFVYNFGGGNSEQGVEIANYLQSRRGPRALVMNIQGLNESSKNFILEAVKYNDPELFRKWRTDINNHNGMRMKIEYQEVIWNRVYNNDRLINVLQNLK